MSSNAKVEAEIGARGERSGGGAAVRPALSKEAERAALREMARGGRVTATPWTPAMVPPRTNT